MSMLWFNIALGTIWHIPSFYIHVQYNIITRTYSRTKEKTNCTKGNIKPQHTHVVLSCFSETATSCISVNLSGSFLDLPDLLTPYVSGSSSQNYFK